MLTKNTKADKKGKKKESKAPTQVAALGADAFITLPQPLQVESARSTEASPAPRAGFRRIGSGDAPSNGGAGEQERAKVAFGLTTKRKADGDANGTPPPKRR
jgi:U4/U6.U5 tri-snRNP-associated protein 1